MTVATLAISIVFFAVAFVWRSVVQRRRTGDWGFRLDRSRSALPRIASLLMVGGFLMIFAAVVCDLVGALGLVAAIEAGIVRSFGVLVMLLALLFTLRAQLDLRDSWRIGVDPNERTELVTDGLFGAVRNPIFSGMLAFAFGAALAVPSWLAIAGAAVVVVGLEVQVRGVEEPHLLRVHGAAYTAYMQRVGRFVPGVGAT